MRWNFSSLRRSRQRSKLDKGGADRRPLGLCAVRCFVSKYEGKYGGGARHEVELSTRVRLWCPFLGKLSRLKALQSRVTRTVRGKRHMPSVECLLLRRSVRRHCKVNVLSKRAQTFTKNRKTFEGTGSCTTT